MNKEKVLLKNTAIVTVGKICTQLITFFLLPIYTAVLTKEEYGIVDLLNTLVGLFLPIVTLQMEQGVFRFLIDCRNDNEKQKKTISTVLIFMTFQLVAYVIIFMIASFFINNQYKYFLASNLIIAIFSSMLLQICRGLGDNKRYAMASFISGVSIVVLNILFVVVFKLGAYGMLLATFMGNLICVIYLLIIKEVYKFTFTKYFDRKELKKIVKYSIPLVPNVISWWVVNASDRTLITAFLGIGQNGVYSAANKFSGLITTVYSVFNLTWTESAAININSEDRDNFFSKILEMTIRIFGAASIGIITFLPFIFKYFINEEFIESYYQIPILIVGSFFGILVSFIGSIYVAKKITKEIAKTSIYAAIINFVTNIVFINKFGLYAASVSTALAYLVMFVYRLIDCKKYVKLKVKSKLTLSLISMAILSIIGYYINNIYIMAGILIIELTYIFIINKRSITYIKKNILKKYVKL